MLPWFRQLLHHLVLLGHLVHLYPGLLSEARPIVSRKDHPTQGRRKQQVLFMALAEGRRGRWS